MGQGCAGHDPGAHAAEVVSAVAQFLQHGDEHGRHAVNRRAALAGEGFQRGLRFEGLAGKNHGGALADSTQHAHHHAEAMVERHRNAQPVGLGQQDPVGHEAGIVDDVVVRQRRPFRCAGGSGGELDVDRIVRVEFGIDRRQPQLLRRAAEFANGIEGENARSGLGAQADHMLQLRKFRGLQPPRFAPIQLGSQLPDHGEVVGRLEAFGRDQRLAADLVQRVFDLGQAVGGIDVDQNDADARGGKLGQQPLVAVRRPDADAVALAKPERQEPGGQLVDFAVEIVVAAANVLARNDHRVPRSEPRNAIAQQLRNGDILQSRFFRPADIGTAVKRRAARTGCCRWIAVVSFDLGRKAFVQDGHGRIPYIVRQSPLCSKAWAAW